MRKVCSINFEPPDNDLCSLVPCLTTFSWSMDYLNTIYIEWIYLGVELHNLMNISNPLTFRVETFQLSLSMKSPLNMNSSGLKRFDSEKKNYALINRECGPYAKIFVVTSCHTDRTKALLYTHTSKTTKSQCFPLLLWTEIQPVHTPVRTQAYGPALS